MRSHRRLIGFVAVLAVAASAASAQTAPVKRHHPMHRHVAAATRSLSFPMYIGNGVDRNPGGDNEYFSDTKSPFRLTDQNSYIIGPAYFQRWWF
jgi:hypothetical protein